MSTFGCSCGLAYATKVGLKPVGWQELGDGELAYLVNCLCQSTICAEFLTDAALCAHCRQPILGTTDDVKVMAPHGAFHLACARKVLGNDPPSFLVPSMIEMMHFGIAPSPEPKVVRAVMSAPAGAFVSHAAVAAAAGGAE